MCGLYAGDNQKLEKQMCKNIKVKLCGWFWMNKILTDKHKSDIFWLSENFII